MENPTALLNQPSREQGRSGIPLKAKGDRREQAAHEETMSRGKRSLSMRYNVLRKAYGAIDTEAPPTLYC